MGIHMERSMEKRILIGLTAGAAVLCLLIFGWLGFRVRSNTNDVRRAADEFGALLQQGELDALTLRFYAYSESDNTVFTDEDGAASVQLVTRQQLAERYGTEAVMASQEPSSRELLLRTIMKYSRVALSAGMTFGQESTVILYLEGPDLKNWLENLSEEEAEYLGRLTDGYLEDLDLRLAADRIPRRTIELEIPVRKQNGTWRFEVSQDIENAFFGNLYDFGKKTERQ